MATRSTAHKEYPVDTILNMARIPKDAMPRFLAELPSILEYLRPTAALQDKLGELDPKVAALILKQAVWVDDGKEEKKTTLEFSNASSVAQQA